MILLMGIAALCADPNAYRDHGAGYANEHDNAVAQVDFAKVIEVTKRGIESGDRRTAIRRSGLIRSVWHHECCRAAA
jgi:hypothetical protein